MTEKEIAHWWDDASRYYQREISKDDLNDVNYGPFGSNESRLKLLGDVRSKNVLELGCGGGQCSIALAKKGALCTGIDLSRKQLDYAQKLASKNKVDITFIKRSFSDLSKFKEGYYDIVISVFALQYAKEFDSIFRNVRRLLKRGGLFVFSIDHPFYLTMEPKNMQISESYYRTGTFKEKETWPDGTKHNSIMYRRKVSDIVNSIIKSGLKLERIVEPLDLNDKIWGTGYRRKLINKIGPTIIFKCKNG